MKRFLILLIAVALVLNISGHSVAHPGHGYYIEEPSDPGDKTSDTSTSTSPGTSKNSATSTTGKSSSPRPATVSHETGSTAKDPVEVSDHGEQSKKNETSPDRNESREENITSDNNHVNGGYGFIPAVAGLCLVFGLTALKFPRK